MGAGVSGVGYLLTQQHPLDPTLQLINFDIALVLAPFLLLGVGLGASPLVLPSIILSHAPPTVLCQVVVEVPGICCSALKHHLMYNSAPRNAVICPTSCCTQNVIFQPSWLQACVRSWLGRPA